MPGKNNGNCFEGKSLAEILTKERDSIVRTIVMGDISVKLSGYKILQVNRNGPSSELKLPEHLILIKASLSTLYHGFPDDYFPSFSEAPLPLSYVFGFTHKNREYLGLSSGLDNISRIMFEAGISDFNDLKRDDLKYFALINDTPSREDFRYGRVLGFCFAGGPRFSSNVLNQQIDKFDPDL